jgi:aspartate/methionine/tyrosine aminotransferase
VNLEACAEIVHHAARHFARAQAAAPGFFSQGGGAGVPAQAAIFAFCDFRPMIAAFAKTNPAAGPGADDWSQEEAFAQFLFNRTGIVLTPGQSCHCQVPGFFRVCYAWVALESLKEALRRLAALQKEILEERGE